MDVATDRKVFLGLQALVVAYGLYSAKHVKERRLKIIKEDKAEHDKTSKAYFIQRVPSATDRWVDHPLGAWIVANLSVIVPAVAALKTKDWIESIIDTKNTKQRLLGALLNFWAFGEAQLAILWLVINKVYKHVPRFNSIAPYPTIGEFLSDYFSTNAIILVLGVFLQDRLEQNPVFAEKLAASRAAGFKPLRFLGSLIILRVWTDFFFWAGHYILHLKSVYWVHKKHHEHNKTRIWTNYHFSTPDLFIEAQLPFVLATIIHTKVTGITLSPLENLLAVGYILGLEGQSHAGKPIPTMSICTPISPLLTKFDDFNVFFHERHHNLLRCNYSITPYWDILFGTARF